MKISSIVRSKKNIKKNKNRTMRKMEIMMMIMTMTMMMKETTIPKPHTTNHINKLLSLHSNINLLLLLHNTKFLLQFNNIKFLRCMLVLVALGHSFHSQVHGSQQFRKLSLVFYQACVHLILALKVNHHSHHHSYKLNQVIYQVCVNLMKCSRTQSL